MEAILIIYQNLGIKNSVTNSKASCKSSPLSMEKEEAQAKIFQFNLRFYFWRRGRDSNPCGVAPKRFSRPPRYDRFDTSPYMKLSFDRNHQIFNCFRNSFRNALLCCFRSAEKVRCCKAFRRFCDRCARKFSRPPRYDRFDNPPCKSFPEKGERAHRRYGNDFTASLYHIPCRKSSILRNKKLKKV